MITSTTKLIAVLAISAGLLTASAAFAKNGSGKSGSGSGSNHTQSQKTSFNAFKLSTNSINSNTHSNSISGISKKPTTLSQTFKKQDFNKDHKNSPLGISVNSLKNDNHSKDTFCKKDNKHCFDWCYPKSCYPYYFGCYYPTYSCYDYCTPTYTTCNYTVSVPLVQNVQPARTLVSVGSVLMMGQSVLVVDDDPARSSARKPVVLASASMEWPCRSKCSNGLRPV